MIHKLKTHTEYFQAIRDGEKTFELRIDDRNFQVGDELELLEFDAEKEVFTGEIEHRTITYIFDGPGFGLRAGHCILALGPRWSPITEPPPIHQYKEVNVSSFLWIRAMQENGRGIVGLGFVTQTEKGLSWYWGEKVKVDTPTHWAPLESPLFFTEKAQVVTDGE